MSRARHDEASRLFTAAVRLPADAREAYVRERAADDAGLAATVLAWLAYDDPDATLAPRNELTRRVGRAAQIDVPPVVGRYRLLDVIGHGGSSVVYRAVQEGLEREVALKLMHPAPADARAVRRFEREAEILATLGHDGIAKIHEFGSYRSPFGPRPFLAMELVHGKPITDHCDDAGLDRDARLKLLAAVADAIHHAHQHAVIHRDIKPGNVLVDERGGVKLVDFGVARPFDARRGALTADGSGPIGTLGYMSPEQVDETWGTIDLRTDVYSLGVLAYRVLCRRMPHEFPTGVGQRPAGVEPADFSRARLGVDLEAVLAKAMAADKRERYGSAADLATDLRRALAGEPVSARAPSRVERARRAVRRHPVVATAAVAALVAVVQQQHHVGRLEDEAARSDRARRTLQIVLTESSAPSLDPLVEAGRYTWLLDGWPAEEADFLVMCARTLGSRAASQEHRQRALEHLERAELLRRGALGDDHPDTLEAAREALALRVRMRRIAEGRDGLAALRARSRDVGSASWLDDLATIESDLLVMEGDVAGALAVLDERVAAAGGEEHARVYLLHGRADLLGAHESLAALRRTSEGWRRAASERDTSLRRKRVLQLGQRDALARLRVAVVDSDAEAVATIRRDLRFGYEQRIEHFSPSARFALWGAYALMRAMAVEGDWEALAPFAEAQLRRMAGRYELPDQLVVQVEAMAARALLGIGRLDEARERIDDLGRVVAVEAPRDAEAAAHVDLVRAEIDAALAPPERRAAILDAARRRLAPRFVPDDERLARIATSS